MDLVTPARFSVPVRHEVVASDWAARGFDCRRFVDPPGQRWEGFVHRTNELLTVVEGRLECELDGRRVEVGPGDELYIPRGVTHSVRNRHAGRTQWLFGYDRG